MKFAIVDDLADDRSKLKALLNEYLLKNNISAILIEFENAESFLEAIETEEFYVAFLDIYMTGKTGMEVAHQLFESGSSTKIVFLSNSMEFLKQSYSVRAVYYLVKPIEIKEFKLAMRFLELKSDNAVPKLSFKQNQIEREISTDKIFYIDVQNHTTRIHFKNKYIPISASFKSLTEPLKKDERFLQCLRGIIVNMDYITGVDDSCFILSNDTRIPINLRNKKQITQKWREYFYKNIEK